MGKSTEECISGFSEDIKKLFNELRSLVLTATSEKVDEKLWANLPSYYVNKSFVRIIPFKDHINIEAKAIERHKNDLTEFKLTPKNMLQIYIGQSIPADILKKIFIETLTDDN